MPSFDVISKVDPQALDNAVNTARKEILSRFDFRGSESSIELDKKTLTINLISENEMRIQAITDVLINRMVKQGIDPKSLDLTTEPYPSGATTRRELKVRQGLDKEVAKKIAKAIKDGGLKVQAAIMDDQVRVTGKKLDDLQAVIAQLRKADFGLPLQFSNMKS